MPSGKEVFLCSRKKGISLFNFPSLWQKASLYCWLKCYNECPTWIITILAPINFPFMARKQEKILALKTSSLLVKRTKYSAQYKFINSITSNGRMLIQTYTTVFIYFCKKLLRPFFCCQLFVVPLFNTIDCFFKC